MKINIQAAKITEKAWFLSRKFLQEKLVKGAKIRSFNKHFRIRKAPKDSVSKCMIQNKRSG